MQITKTAILRALEIGPTYAVEKVTGETYRIAGVAKAPDDYVIIAQPDRDSYYRCLPLTDIDHIEGRK